MIIKCNCTADINGNRNATTFQDETYGKQNRVANLNQKGKATCTVCGKEHSVSNQEKEEKKTKKTESVNQ